ncbi:hypothetical protein CEXT_583931 [Caerostris extrusa]|uniref:Uncharacterized protein n=1 Tax=Caerostris extrusa TaxID=172846 RepID=A0AAV4RXT5_CAEEX|nr:hypothetical protein CEXT_583931 [Caerostris extrusa]
MNKEQAYSSTVKLVAKYRKLLSWWTFVKKIPHIMDSNMDVINELIKANNIPSEIINKIRIMEQLSRVSVEDCMHMQVALEKLTSLIESHITTVANYRPEISDSVNNSYKELCKKETEVYNLFDYSHQKFNDFYFFWSFNISMLTNSPFRGLL